MTLEHSFFVEWTLCSTYKKTDAVHRILFSVPEAMVMNNNNNKNKNNA